MKSKKKYKFPFLSILFIILFTALDQFVKHLAVINLKDKPSVILIDGVLELQYLENRGAAFGIMQNQKLFFVFMAIIILIAILYLLITMPGQLRYLPLNIVFVFVAAGAIGNMIDRVYQGYVVDFIYFSLINFPIFNIADIYVTCSMIVLIILVLFYYREDELYFLSFNIHNFKDR